MKFDLEEYDKDGNIVLVGYSGCYLITDGGYLKWSVAIPPIKNTTSLS